MKNTTLALLVSALIVTSTGLMNANVPTSTDQVLKELKSAGVDTSAPIVVEIAQDTAAEIAADPASAQEQIEAVKELFLPLATEQGETTVEGDTTKLTLPPLATEQGETTVEGDTTKLTLPPLATEQGETIITVAGKRIPVLPGFYAFYTDAELKRRLDNLKSAHVRAALSDEPAMAKRTMRLQKQIDILNRRIAYRANLTSEQKDKREANLKKNLLDRRAKVLFRLTTVKAKPLSPQRDTIVARLTKRLEVIDALLDRMK